MSVWHIYLYFGISATITLCRDYDTDIYWAYNNLLGSLPTWLWLLLTSVACLVPDFTIRMLQRALNIKHFSIFPGKQRKLKMREKAENTYL